MIKQLFKVVEEKVCDGYEVSCDACGAFITRVSDGEHRMIPPNVAALLCIRGGGDKYICEDCLENIRSIFLSTVWHRHEDTK